MTSEDINLARALKLDTAAISDAMDKLGIAGQCLGIKPLDHRFHLAGRAFTVRCAAAKKPAGSVGDYIDDVPAGAVVAVDNGGREDATVWGDILTFLAHRKGVAGTVIDGACRDVRLCLELGYPVYSRSYSMRTGKDRVMAEAYNEPVSIGTARVEAGDLVFGDADGVVVLPRAHEDRIIAVAEEISVIEERIREALRAGARLEETRASLGYHLLQRRENS